MKAINKIVTGVGLTIYSIVVIPQEVVSPIADNIRQINALPLNTLTYQQGGTSYSSDPLSNVNPDGGGGMAFRISSVTSTGAAGFGTQYVAGMITTPAIEQLNIPQVTIEPSENLWPPISDDRLFK